MAINDVAGEWLCIMYEIFFGEILGDNFVSGLRTLKPKSVKLENF